MIGVVVWERTTWAISKETAALYPHFPMFTPGLFRRLLKSAVPHAPTSDVTLTSTDAPLEHPYCVVEGPIRIEKSGTSYLAWPADTLRQMMEKSPKFKITLSAQFNDELVRKAARSVTA